MSDNLRRKATQNATALTALTGATAGSVTGASQIELRNTGALEPTVAAYTKLVVNESTITMQARWEVSADGTNWYPVAGAAGTVRTGTGSPVTFEEIIALPFAAACWTKARIAIVTGVATAGVADKFQSALNFLTPPFN